MVKAIAASNVRGKGVIVFEPFAGTFSFQQGSHSIASTFSSGRKPMLRVGLVRRIVAAFALIMATAMTAPAQEINDYPTSARAEYVFGCMKANGETRRAIEQCSCSIDVVASLLPYDRYVTAETVLSMSQVRTDLGGQFRTSEQAASALNDLRR